MDVANNACKVCIIIPSLEPDENLLLLIDELHSEFLRKEGSGVNIKILIVNDGSSSEYEYIFQKAKIEYGCILLRHTVNLGKGRALKTAFNYCLTEFPEFDGVVTVDSDGQHAVPDIKRCISQLYGNPSLILGTRNFEGGNIPFKSRFGNKLTRRIFRFLWGGGEVNLTDTQTGLRVIPTALLPMMLPIEGDRFEYEMNMLIECAEQKIPIIEIPIETIYSNNNQGTHFNPLRDSVKIYASLFKYSISSLSAFAVDILFFYIFQSFTKPFLINYIFISTILARAVSSLYNYLVNKKLVFSKSSGQNTALKYYILAVFQMLVSGVFTRLLFSLAPLSEVSSKIFVDTILWFISFSIQKNWVF